MKRGYPHLWLLILCVNLFVHYYHIVEVLAGHQCYGKDSTDTNNVCSGRGTCVSANVCQCAEPSLFGGQECEIGLCGGLYPTDSNVCSGVGVCELINAFATCTCSKDVQYQPNDYLGYFCEIPTCLDFDISTLEHDMSNVCNLRGKCIGVNACVCDRNATIAYGGFSCEKSGFSCFGVKAESSQSCSGNGICIDSDICSCDPNHVGSDCSIPKCYNVTATESNVCSSNGRCIGVNNCQCNSGYSGENCQFYGTSSASTTTVTLVSSLNFTCFGLEKSNSFVCSGKGECMNQDICSCMVGYYGHACEKTSCFGFPMNHSQSCNSRGVCKGFNQCQCLSNSNNVLLNGPDCGNMYCQGFDKQYYLSTDPNVCSGKGQCTIKGCLCDEGFYGDSCSQFDCFSKLNNDSTVCSSHGKCVAIDTCECFYNETFGFWIGEECNICDNHNESTLCSNYCSDEKSCNNMGTCRGGACICSDNFSGTFCQECKQEFYGPMCDNYCRDTTSCNSHGSCTRDGGFCECFNSLEDGHWKGLNCSQCKDGYYGSKCQISIDGLFSFNHLGNEIHIPVTVPSTNSSLQPFTCSYFFSDTTLQKLGGVTCLWMSVQGSLKVHLNSSASILPGDSIEMDVNSIEFQSIPVSRHYVKVNSSLTHNITVVPIPKILYVENETFLSFTGVSGAPIEREGPNSFLWTISDCQMLDLSATCKSSLQSTIDSQKRSRTVIIEKQHLPINMNSLSIQLELTNRFGLSYQPTILLVNTTLMTSSNSNVNKSIIYTTVYSVEMMVDRNPVAFTLNTIPLFVEKRFSINGVETEISSPYTIEYSMYPPPPQDSTPSDIVILLKDSKDNLIIDVPGFDISPLDPTKKYQIMTVVKKGLERVANNSFDIYFGITSDKFYLKVPSFSFDSNTFPITISVNVPSSSIMSSIQWTCAAHVEYNGKCHSGLDSIMTTATLNNQISISISKSTFYMFNSEFTISVRLQTLGGQTFSTFKLLEPYWGISITSRNLNGNIQSAQNTMGTVWLVSSSDVLKLSLSKATGVGTYISISSTISVTVYTGFDSTNVDANPGYLTYSNALKTLTITGSQFSSNVKVVLSYTDATDSITYKYNIYIYRNTANLSPVSVTTNVETSKIFTYYDYVKVTVDLVSMPFFRPYLFITLDLPNRVNADSCQDHGESKLVCEFVIPPMMENTKLMVKSKFLKAEMEPLNAISAYVISQQISQLTASSASPHKAVHSLQRIVFTDNSQLSYMRQQLNRYLNNLNLDLYQNSDTV